MPKDGMAWAGLVWAGVTILILALRDTEGHGKH